MRVISLQSGSNGNCIYVEAGGARLLFDAGVSGRQVKERLAQHGRDATAVDAVVINRKILGDRFPLFVADRYGASGAMEV
jgi:hypothetical protein